MFETRGVTIPAQDPDRESYFKLLDDSGSSFGSSKKQNCNTNRSVMVVGLDPKLKSDFQPLGNSGSGSSKSGLVTPLLVTTNACSTDSAANTLFNSGVCGARVEVSPGLRVHNHLWPQPGRQRPDLQDAESERAALRGAAFGAQALACPDDV